MSVTQLRIEIGLGPDADEEELEHRTQLLRRELLQADVDDVTIPSQGPAPEGARGGPSAEVGTLLVDLVQSAGGVAGVVAMLRAWLARDRGRTAKLKYKDKELELEGLSKDLQHRLAEELIRED